jgi:hypothetical protein
MKVGDSGARKPDGQCVNVWRARGFSLCKAENEAPPGIQRLRSSPTKTNDDVFQNVKEG